MRYHLAPLFCRPWTLNGISPRLIESHYENNYGAAVNRLNAIVEELEALDFEAASPDVVSRPKRVSSRLSIQRSCMNYISPALVATEEPCLKR